MYNVNGFIKWALLHVKPDTVPAKAVLPVPVKDCGAEPWRYLFGTVRARTTRDKLEERWKNYYRSHGWTRAQYDAATKGWKSTDYATDCQGLLDAYLTYERGEKTDINAHMNYTNWCMKKGKIADIERPYTIGEAVFMQSATTGKMNHVGWICGFDVDGEPLVIEARGLAYGVVVTRFESRPWTHRGLMTRKFNYESEENSMTKFELTSPMRTGKAYKAMQKALNAAGYTDANGKKLSEDGKWGAKSQAAFNELLKAHGQAVSGDAKHKLAVSVDGRTVYSAEV